MRAVISTLARAAAAMVLLLPAIAGGQGRVYMQRAYCNITAVESKRLTNAVQVTIKADGLMAPDIQSRDLFNVDAARMGRRDKMGKRITEIPIRIWNARSQVGSIANIGIYPVSHVEVTVPPEAVEGIGVHIRVVLYKPAMTREVRLPGDRWSFDATGESPPFISIEQSQDRRAIIILVTSDRRTLPPAPPRRVPDPARAVLQVTSERGLISIYARDIGIQDLMREIGRAAGVSITAAGTLDRSVSVSLDIAPLEEALRCIAMTCGASLVPRDGGYYLADSSISDTSAYYGSSFAEIPLRYITASAARDSLPDLLLAHVQVDPGRNSLTVVGSPEMVDKVRRDLEQLDQPVPAVEVTTTVAEFQTTSDLIQALGARFIWKGGTTSLADMSDIVFSSVSATPQELALTLRALETRGRVHLRSQSRTVVLNGRTARLFLGRTKQIAAQYFDFWTNSLETRILTVRYGTTLEVTPWTSGRGVILTHMRSESSDVVETERVTGNPTLAQRSAETTVRLNEGETLFVGGLDMSQTDASNRALLGSSWSYPRGRAIRESRLAIFVTVRTVEGSASFDERPTEPPQ